MLSPNSRCLYTSALTPPPGMIFDEAIATTFSMDPALLLEAPVYLALMAADGQSDPDPLSVLEAIRRYSKRITVYVQKGRIQVPQITKPNPLFGFLEEMVVEVTAPGGGVFHPKIWAIRFVSPDQSSSMYRLVVLTRNMTTDQSWDLSLQLEGTIAGRKSKSNKPLLHFFKALPDLASGTIASERIEQSFRFADELHRVQWELPDGFDELTFYLPGTKGFDWEPPMANRLAVISPFCSDEALRLLAQKSKAADALISRPESLSALKKETLDLFTQCLHLDDAAETEDGEEDDATEQPLATGLHAKVYLLETRYYSDYTHVIMGSANATNAALNASKNIEILVGLVGRKSKIGGIDELLGTDGLGEYLVDFDTTKEIEADVIRQKAEESVEQARSLISETALSVKCNLGSKDGLWDLVLIGKIPSLKGIVNACAWPITVMKDFAVDILGNDDHGMISLGEFSASSVTGLIAFELKSNHPDVTARFVLNLPVTVIPAERNSAILQTIISNQDGFLRYLMLLLGDEFGHPEWIDFPREGNKWSYHHSRRMWSLAFREDLLFAGLRLFEEDMQALLRNEGTLRHAIDWLHLYDHDKVICFRRGSLLFVFNFHPTQALKDYRVPAPLAEYEIALCSDAARYSGFGLLDLSHRYHSQRNADGASFVPVYLPPRQVLALRAL